MYLQPSLGDSQQCSKFERGAGFVIEVLKPPSRGSQTKVWHLGYSRQLIFCSHKSALIPAFTMHI
jgi:hypothetical protein